jgi:tetratricopeptide (TPR) repeat protein
MLELPQSPLLVVVHTRTGSSWSRRAATLALGGFLVLAGPGARVSGDEAPKERGELARTFDRGDYPRAIELARGRLQAEPRDVEAQIVLARAEAALGRFEAAFGSFRKALRLDAGNADALYYLSLTAGVLAEAEYQRLMTLAPDSARAHQLMGESFRVQELAAEAEAKYKAALEKNPESVEVLVALGDLTRSKSRFDEALAYYTRAAALAPRRYEALFGIGVCLSYQGQHSKAVDSLREALRVDAKSAPAHLALGISLLRMERTQDAVTEFETAAALEPRMRQAYYQLGRAYRALGRTADADAAMAKVQELLGNEMDSEEILQPPDPP